MLKHAVASKPPMPPNVGPEANPSQGASSSGLGPDTYFPNVRGVTKPPAGTGELVEPGCGSKALPSDHLMQCSVRELRILMEQLNLPHTGFIEKQEFVASIREKTWTEVNALRTLELRSIAAQACIDISQCIEREELVRSVYTYRIGTLAKQPNQTSGSGEKSAAGKTPSFSAQDLRAASQNILENLRRGDPATWAEAAKVAKDMGLHSAERIMREAVAKGKGDAFDFITKLS